MCVFPCGRLTTGYQGHQKLSPPEPNYSGDWGDWIAFTQHMRSRAEARGVDLLLVDTGDLRAFFMCAAADADDGNGLCDAFPPTHRHAVNGHVSNEVFALADYDLLTIGNHELYNYSVALDVYHYFVPHCASVCCIILTTGGDRYVTSNVNITLADGPGQAPRSRPFGPRYTRFTTPNQGLQIQAYGVLFNFQLGAPGITVQDPVAMVREPWFQASLRAHDHVDAFVIAGHMPATGHRGWDALHAAIRRMWPSTPILMLAGHTHERDCRMPDDAAMVLESGRYLETVGWMSVGNVSAQPPRFSRRYIDANPRNYAYHAGLAHAGQLSTARGRFVRSAMEAVARAWNLTDLYGLVPHDYYLDRVPFGHEHALLTLLTKHILPDVVAPSNERHRNVPTLLLINSGSQRFDVFAGALTKNDQCTSQHKPTVLTKDVVSPFHDEFWFVADVPWRIAKRLVGGLNRRGATHNETPGAAHAAQAAADSVFHRYLGRQWTAYWTRILSTLTATPSEDDTAAPPPATSGRPEQARRLEELLRALETDPDSVSIDHAAFETRFGQPPSMGYATVDACPGQGDDTRHTPVPYSSYQPDYVAAEPTPTPADDTRVDVVFVDFIARPIVELLNQWDLERTYSVEDDAKVWSNVSTQWLYPLYAQQAWHPRSFAEAWDEMDRAASAAGYPPVAQYDAYAGDPYEPVVLAQRNEPLVFQH